MPANVAVGSSCRMRSALSWRRGRDAGRARRRLRIVLLASEGLKNTEIAERLEIDRAMARKWRSRFAEHRLDGLLDEPRPGADFREFLPNDPEVVSAVMVRADARSGRGPSVPETANVAPPFDYEQVPCRRRPWARLRDPRSRGRELEGFP